MSALYASHSKEVLHGTPRHDAASRSKTSPRRRTRSYDLRVRPASQSHERKHCSQTPSAAVIRQSMKKQSHKAERMRHLPEPGSENEGEEEMGPCGLPLSRWLRFREKQLALENEWHTRAVQYSEASPTLAMLGEMLMEEYNRMDHYNFQLAVAVTTSPPDSSAGVVDWRDCLPSGSPLPPDFGFEMEGYADIDDAVTAEDTQLVDELVEQWVDWGCWVRHKGD